MAKIPLEDSFERRIPKMSEDRIEIIPETISGQRYWISRKALTAAIILTLFPAVVALVAHLTGIVFSQWTKIAIAAAFGLGSGLFPLSLRMEYVAEKYNYSKQRSEGLDEFNNEKRLISVLAPALAVICGVSFYFLV